MKNARLGSASPGRRTARRARRSSLVATLATLLLLGASGSASAVVGHLNVTAEFGPDGTAATNFGTIRGIAYDQAADQIFLIQQSNALYGLEITSPGNATPVTGFTPKAVEATGSDLDIGVDNSAESSAGNIYIGRPLSAHRISGFTGAGALLPAPWPVDTGNGELCGVDVDGEGNVWGGVFNQPSRVVKFNSAGVFLGSITTPVIENGTCRVTLDPVTNDLYQSEFRGAVYKWTAASGYTSRTEIDPPTDDNQTRLSFDGARDLLYVSHDSQIRAYDASASAKIEDVEFPGTTFRGAEVDEDTNTIYAFSPTTNRIKEIRYVAVPVVATGEPIGNAIVSGTVDPDGEGEVTECLFEFGPTTSYGEATAPCEPAPPYAAPQAVTATLPASLDFEKTYHYRLVAKNASGENFGTDRTIAPHNVLGVETHDAANVTRTTADLNASFEGNGEETHYYFEWGPTTSYGQTSAAPPGPSVGSPTAPPATELTFNATGLSADTEYHCRVVAENPIGVTLGNDRTFKTPPAVQSLVTEAVTDLLPRSATINASFDGDGDETNYYFEYGETTGYGSTSPVVNAGSPSGPAPLSAPLSGLELETTYHYRVVATNSLGTTIGGDQSFTTPPAVAGVTTHAASAVSQEALTLNGEFSGNGEPTTFYFEWGPTASYGNITAEPPGDDAGSPSGPTTVSAVLTQFYGYTTYHYRVVAVNSFGSSYGADETVTTLPAPLPSIESTAASDVGETSATLEAEINPSRWDTGYEFEYGTTAAYGSEVLGANVIAGNKSSAETVSESIAGLTPGVTYHFRVVAINFRGTSYGPDLTFRTPAAPVVEAPIVVPPSAAPATPASESKRPQRNCGKFARLAKRNSNRAKRLRRRAARASGRRQARTARRRAARFARQARRLSRKSKACRRTSGRSAQ